MAYCKQLYGKAYKEDRISKNRVDIIVSFISSTITFFCTYDGDTFVDLILHCSRTAYQTLFHQIAIIDVQKIVY